MTYFIDIIKTLLVDPFLYAATKPTPLSVLTACWIGLTALLGIGTLIHLSFKKVFPCRKDLKRVNDIVSQFKSDTIAEQFEELDSNLKRDSFVGHTWTEFGETLFKIRDIRGRDIIYNAIDPANFFNVQKLIHPQINLRFYGSLPAILTGLGILGTFVGLSLGLSKVTFVTGSASMKMMEEGIQGLLKSANLAFSTSIWGIGFSLLFLSVERRILNNLQGDVTTLLQSIERLFERKTSESLLSDVLSESHQQTAALQTIATDLATEMAELLGQKMTQTIAPGIDKLNAAVESLTRFKEESSLEAIEKLTQEFRKSLMEGTETEIDELRQVLGDVGKALQAVESQSREGISKLVSQLEDGLSKQQERLEATSAVINQSLMEQITLTSQKISNLVESLQAHSSSLSQDMANRIEELSSTLSRRLEEVSVRFGEERGEIRDLLDSLRQMIDKLENAVVGAGMAAEAFEHSAIPIQEVTKELRTSIETWHHTQRELSEFVRNYQDLTKGHMDTSERILEHIRSSLSSSQEAWSAYEDKFGLIQDGLKTILSELHQGLLDYSKITGDSITKYLSELDEKTASALSHIEGTIEQILEIMEGLEGLSVQPER